MLKIVIDNKEVEYRPDISIQLKFGNPLFSDKKINEAYSYSFSLPATPTLNAIYLNSNRVNSVANKVKKPLKIYHSGVLFIKGVVRIEESNDNSYKCYAQNEGFDLYKETNDASLLDTDLGKVELWTAAEDATLTPTQKLDRWANHMDNTNSAGPTATAYKFPQIKAHYDFPGQDDADIQTEGNNYVFHRSGIVNGYLQDAVIKNSIVPKGYYGNDKNWHHTISPCLRADFVLQEILKQYNIELVANDLELIKEYFQLLFFSNKVKDKYEDLGTSTVNLHGRNFSLNDFVPDTNQWELFIFLNEIFDCHFFISDNEMRIRTSAKVLNGKSINVTEYANPETITKDKEQKGISIFYDINQEQMDQYNLAFYALGNTEGWQFNSIETTSVSKLERKLNHLPLNNIFAQGGTNIIQNYTQFGSLNPPSEFEFLPVVTLSNIDSTKRTEENYLMLVSDEFPNSGKRAERFFAILFRGYYPTIRYDYNETTGAYDPNSPIAINTFFPCNLEDTEDFLNYPNPPISPIYFSDKHIFLTEAASGEQKGTYNTYHKKYYDLTNGAREVKKELHLPVHKVKELSRFDNPKHIIDNPRGRFTGYVKDFDVTLKANSISSTAITYLFQV